MACSNAVSCALLFSLNKAAEKRIGYNINLILSIYKMSNYIYSTLHTMKEKYFLISLWKFFWDLNITLNYIYIKLSNYAQNYDQYLNEINFIQLFCIILRLIILQKYRKNYGALKIRIIAWNYFFSLYIARKDLFYFCFQSLHV